MKRTLTFLCLGFLLATLPACYPHYGVPPGHAKRHLGFWPGWNAPGWHAPSGRGIKPKNKYHPARYKHHR